MAQTPSTNPEHDKLIEVLKFTPRTYKITLWGYGGELVLGKVNKKVWDYFREHRINLSDYATDSDYGDNLEVPEDCQPFMPGNWYDCDDMYHGWGVSKNAGTLQIMDENDEVVYERELEDLDGTDVQLNCGDEVWTEMNGAGSCVFYNYSSEKGTFFEGTIELKSPFDPEKLSFTYDDVEGEELISSISYDDEVLENFGGDTNGKGYDFSLYYLDEDGDTHQYRDGSDVEDDFDDGTPPMGPGPEDWERSPKFEGVNPVRTGWYSCNYAGGSTYSSLYWNGERNVWEYYHNGRAIATYGTVNWWYGYNWDTSDWNNQPKEPTKVKEETVTTNTGWPHGPAPFPGSDKPAEKKELTAWTVSTYYKKSIEEHEHFTKDGKEIVHKQGWRSGSWIVYTNDGNPPEFEFTNVPGGNDAKDSIDINSCYSNNIEEVELDSTFDGCWSDIDWPEDMDEDEQTELEEAMEEDGYYDALESRDWYSSDTEMWIWGPILIEGDNGYRRIIEADENGNVTDFKEEN